MTAQQFNLFESSLEPKKQEPKIHEQRIFGADYGSGFFHVTSSIDENFHQKHSHETFLTLNFCKKGDVIVIENGHLQPRNEERKVSRAQPYTFNELKILKENARRKEIEIRLFPQSQTLRYRATFFPEQQKSDKIDAQTLGLAALQIGVQSLQKFNPRPAGDWTDFERWMFEQIKDMNEILNQYRESPETANSFCPCIDLFEKKYLKIIACFEQRYREGEFSSNIYNDTRLWLLSSKRKVGESSSSVLLALWCSLVDWNGDVRLFKEKPLSLNKTWSYLLQNKPNHFKGGIARSNVWHWGFKAGVLGAEFHKKNLANGYLPKDLSDEQYLKFAELKKRYRYACKAVLLAMRDVCGMC